MDYRYSRLSRLLPSMLIACGCNTSPWISDIERPLPARLSKVGIYLSLETLDPAPSLLAYEPVWPLYANGADKSVRADEPRQVLGSPLNSRSSPSRCSVDSSIPRSTADDCAPYSTSSSPTSRPSASVDRAGPLRPTPSPRRG
jgi:hypothetical protein